LREIRDNYKKNSLPLDTLWSDIDYLENYKDFTFDKTNFEGLPDLVAELHASNQQYIPIIDAGIAMRPNQSYSAYD